MKATKSPNAVLDGEVCALDERAASSFSAMQQGSGPLVYFAFDLLEDDGRAARRPRRCASAAAGSERLLDRRNRVVRLSEAFDDGEALLEAAKAQGLEGDRRQAARLRGTCREAHAATGSS